MDDRLPRFTITPDFAELFIDGIGDDGHWWHAEGRPYMAVPDRCRHGVEDATRWICRAGRVVYRDTSI
jgi:hypothetical protein